MPENGISPFGLLGAQILCGKVPEHRIQSRLGFLVQISRIPDGLDDVRMGLVHMGAECMLKVGNLLDRDLPQEVIDHRINHDHLMLHRHGSIPVLLEHLHDPFALGKPLLGVLIQIGAELGECL